jgi:hypothetical protein
VYVPRGAVCHTIQYLELLVVVLPQRGKNDAGTQQSCVVPTELRVQSTFTSTIQWGLNIPGGSTRDVHNCTSIIEYSATVHMGLVGQTEPCARPKIRTETEGGRVSMRLHSPPGAQPGKPRPARPPQRPAHNNPLRKIYELFRTAQEQSGVRQCSCAPAPPCRSALPPAGGQASQRSKVPPRCEHENTAATEPTQVSGDGSRRAH